LAGDDGQAGGEDRLVVTLMAGAVLPRSNGWPQGLAEKDLEDLHRIDAHDSRQPHALAA